MSGDSSQVRRIFLGTSSCSLDPQRRIILPKSWRLDSDTTATKFYLTPANTGIIRIYDSVAFNKLYDLIAGLNEFDEEIQNALMFFGAKSSEFSPDKQGRFSIPPEIIEHGSLHDKVFMIGAVTHGYLLSSELWEKCGCNVLAIKKLEKAFETQKAKL